METRMIHMTISIDLFQVRFAFKVIKVAHEVERP